jgi:hypothetical protein
LFSLENYSVDLCSHIWFFVVNLHDYAETFVKSRIKKYLITGFMWAFFSERVWFFLFLVICLKYLYKFTYFYMIIIHDKVSFVILSWRSGPKNWEICGGFFKFCCIYCISICWFFIFLLRNFANWEIFCFDFGIDFVTPDMFQWGSEWFSIVWDSFCMYLRNFVGIR